MKPEYQARLERWATSLPSPMQQTCAAALEEIAQLREKLSKFEEERASERPCGDCGEYIPTVRRR